MGDRANIFVVDKAPAAADNTELHGIYLYTHWKGYHWPELLRQALATPDARRRWSDAPYLVRIVARELFASATTDTGYGISTVLTDNEYPITILDVRDWQRPHVAWAMLAGTETDPDQWVSRMTLEDFVDQVEAVYPEWE